MKTGCSLQFCLNRLTPAQYCVYLACCELWSGDETAIYMANIADLVFVHVDVVRYHMKNLQRLGFVAYDTSNSVNTVLLWVRRSESEIAPNVKDLKRKHLAIRLRSQDGKTLLIRPGEIRKTCEQYGLNRRCVYDLLEGKRKTHKGWIVAK